MVAQKYSGISKEEFEKILKKLEHPNKEEDYEESETPVTFKQSEKPVTNKIEFENKFPKNEQVEEKPQPEVLEKKIEEIENKAINLVISYLRKKGYSQEFIQENIDVIEDMVFDILYS